MTPRLAGRYRLLARASSTTWLSHGVVRPMVLRTGLATGVPSSKERMEQSLSIVSGSRTSQMQLECRRQGATAQVGGWYGPRKRGSHGLPAAGCMRCGIRAIERSRQPFGAPRSRRPAWRRTRRGRIIYLPSARPFFLPVGPMMRTLSLVPFLAPFLMTFQVKGDRATRTTLVQGGRRIEGAQD